MNSNQEQLVYWINEREAIRQRKAHDQPKPWSDNPVMQTTYFCNVHREDDKVTKWLRETFDATAEFYADIEEYPSVANFCMARLVNRIESLKELFWPWEYFRKADFKHQASRLKPFWGNAYVVTTHGQRMSKVDYAVDVLGHVFKANPTIPIGYTLEAAHRLLCTLEGFGSFMAAQVVADLKNTQGHTLGDADDYWVWSAPGPGSLRGLTWFFEEKVSAPNYDWRVKRAWEIVMDDVPPMDMQDFQNCLCEYDKFMRVTNGTGRSKRKYQGV